ncbi:gas vesicle protein GvpO [Sphaerisporangium rhizosphaerae]|uniref:Gas vesicle protein n=1 Tax=Sphaerisporangium rhizosphaerae TaxID=2269375 RepID=A0ABW2PG91_9ACTN
MPGSRRPRDRRAGTGEDRYAYDPARENARDDEEYTGPADSTEEMGDVDDAADVDDVHDMDDGDDMDDMDDAGYAGAGDGYGRYGEEEDAPRGTRRPARRAGTVSGPRTSRRLTAATAGRAGLDYMAELTGKDVEGVTLVKPAGDGWTVEVEVVEDHRIPSSGDTLAIYAIDLDSEGDLVSYRRVRSYKRAKGDTGGVY